MPCMRALSLLAGRYRLETQIAAGAVGEVWRADDTVLARPVAVKILRDGHASHAETLARFRAEARHAGALSHPAIARVYDYGEPEPPTPPFLVMELVNGPSLATLLADGPLDARQTMDVVAQVAAGLQTAHEAGLVHRDIKPANLLLAPGGQVKITDFGIAHAAGSAPVTRTGAVIGTPSYLAPERITGASATPAADLYSLGVVAHECLTGAPPFSGSPVEVAVAHRDRPLPALPPTVPDEVARLVTELTAKDPAARPASAGEVAVRAASLRDRQGADVAAAATSWLPALPDTLMDVTAPGPLAGSEPGTPWPARQYLPWPGRDVRLSRRPATVGRRHWPLSWRLAAGVAVLAMLGALGLVTALSGTAQSPQQPTVAGTRSASPHTIDVSAGSLIGQPVALARQRLEALGLNVRIQWHPSDQQAGTVLSVEPSGQVQAASTVVLTAAFSPGHHGDGHGNGDGGGKGDGGGNGGG
jgi:eukaryotic-like serine/threonine-protein kinase